MAAPATNDPRAVARRFIDAFDARDVDALLALVTDDVELRKLNGDALRGPDGVRTLLATAQDLDIRLVPFRREEVERHDGHAHVTVPVRELVGPDDIERIVELEIRDGRVAAFAVRPMQ